MPGEDITILPAGRNDLDQILTLQRLAYESEARLLNDWSIQPLLETMEDMTCQFDGGVFLKAMDTSRKIVGSVRGRVEHDTLHIGKLMVHPAYQGKGIGKRLLREIEERYPQRRFQLFTSDKSTNNLALYEKSGYVRFAEKPLETGFNLVFLEKVTTFA